ncbi:MAG: NAD(P)H-binding protein [Myxococcota bacterium]|nr:NAD(P)H-binding protein [Myxococcota bacterium]
MKILITGANGNLGRQLVQRLCQEPDRQNSDSPGIRALVRSERAAKMIREMDCPNPPEIMVGDYTDAGSMKEAVSDCDGVVHLVGIIKETSTTSYPQAHEDTCRTLAHVLKDSSVRRIVYLSILGSHSESSNACLASKGRAEALLAGGPCPATILRVPMVLGPDDYASAALRKEAQSKIVSLAGGGRTLQQPIDSCNVIDAILASLKVEHAETRDFDLGGPESMAHRDLIQRAARLYQRKPWTLPIPLPLARFFVGLLEGIGKNPPITRAMFDILQHDDRTDPTSCCEELGISLTALDETLACYVGPESQKK